MTTAAINSVRVNRAVNKNANIEKLSLKKAFSNYIKELVDFYGEIYGRAYNCRYFI